MEKLLPKQKQAHFHRLKLTKKHQLTKSTYALEFKIPDALKAEADIFLTADLKYHDFFVPSGRMMVCDIGHYESEVGVKEWLHATLIEKFPTFAVFKTGLRTNPVNYYT